MGSRTSGLDVSGICWSPFSKAHDGGQFGFHSGKERDSPRVAEPEPHDRRCHEAAAVTIVKDGRDLASVGVPLPAPAPDGRSVYVGRVPTTGYGAGVYQLKVSLEHAGVRESRSASFRVESRGSGPTPSRP